MRLRPGLVAAALALAVATLGGCTLGPGSPPPVSTEGVRRAEDDAASLFARAEALRERGEWDEARSTFTAVTEDYPASPLATEAQFQAAECAYGARRWWPAGMAFGQFMEDRPLTEKVAIVEKRMYDIGDFLVEDGKRGLWGTGVFEYSDQGIQILRRLATVMPTGNYADDALMRIGRYYAEVRDFEGAEQTLDELLKNYPDSEWRLEARFLLAWVCREDNRGPEYDGRKLREARAHFRTFVDRASQTAAAKEEYADRIAAANAEVEAIDGDLARKALARAALYERMERPEAALFVLEEAARTLGRTAPGRECAERAAALGKRLGVQRPAAPPEPPPPAEGDAKPGTP